MDKYHGQSKKEGRIAGSKSRVARKARYTEDFGLFRFLM